MSGLTQLSTVRSLNAENIEPNQASLDLSTMGENAEHAVADSEAFGDKANMTHEEVAQVAQLTGEEKAIEKKLRRRIDSLIMPLVILVYLMNYIDRWVVQT